MPIGDALSEYQLNLSICEIYANFRSKVDNQIKLLYVGPNKNVCTRWYSPQYYGGNLGWIYTILR
jgi:hypothetical protein